MIKIILPRDLVSHKIICLYVYKQYIEYSTRLETVLFTTSTIHTMAARILLRRQVSICRIINAAKSARTTSTIGNFDNNIKENDYWRTELMATMRIFENFISPEEEDSLFREVEPYMKRLRYEFSHWDDAIHGYRETERAKWNEDNTKIIERVKAQAFPPGMPELGLVHVLDLAAEGEIKPHVDSVRFCGDIIAGISLLSDCVMRLTQVGNEKECRQDFFLPRRSLYIMSGVARHKYNHHVLAPEESIFNGKKVDKTRRISIICRSAPDPRRKD